MTNQPSAAPWSYGYSPYTVRNTDIDDPNAIGQELPAFEVFDAEGSKIFDTNEDTPADLQEANACLAAAAPAMLAALMDCTRLLADYDEHEGEEGEAYRAAVAAIDEATGHRRGS